MTRSRTIATESMDFTGDGFMRRRDWTTLTISVISAGVFGMLLGAGCEQNSRIGEEFDVGAEEDGGAPTAQNDASLDDAGVDATQEDGGDTTSDGGGDLGELDGGDTGDGGQSYPASNFEEFRESTAELASAIACREASESSCREDRVPPAAGEPPQSICVSRMNKVESLGQLPGRHAHQKAVDEGRQTFDAEAAEACVERLKEELDDSTPCEQFFGPFESPSTFNADDPENPCERVFRPAVEQDGKCLIRGDCKSGMYCDLEAESGECWGRCKSLSAQGESCDFTANNCESGLRCVDGTCQQPPERDIGEQCKWDTQCSGDLNCIELPDDGQRCREPQGPGQPCTTTGGCESGTVCAVDPADPDGTDRICVKRESKGDGETCTETAMCESGLTCTDEDVCRSFSLGGRGDACDGDREYCESGLACRPTSATGDRECASFGTAGDSCMNATCGAGLYCKNGGDGTGTCRPRLENGADCEPGACEGTSYCNHNSICVDRAAAGSLCRQKHCEVGVHCRFYEDKKVCGGISARCSI